mgnify:CR=1 FL=1
MQIQTAKEPLSNTQANIYVRKELNEPIIYYAAGATAFQIDFMLFIIYQFGKIARDCDRLGQIKSIEKFRFKTNKRGLINFIKHYDTADEERQEKAIDKTIKEVLCVMYIENNKDFIEGFQLLSKAKYEKKDKTLEFWINPSALEYFIELQKNGKWFYTQLNFNEANILKSKYAKILYLILNKEEYKKGLTIDYNELKKAFGNENVRSDYFKRIMLNPAVKELKQIDKFLALSYEYHYKNKPIGQKGGKMIDSITFEWNYKQLEIFELPNYAEIQSGRH